MTHQIFHGDCLEIMPTLPDKTIDLFVLDLPYGQLEPQRTRSAEYVKKVKSVSVGQSSCAWDIKLDLNALWTQIKRLCKDDHTPVLMFCNTKFGFELYNSNPDWFRYDLVWNKMRGVSFLSANKMPMKAHEMVYVFSKKGASYYRKDIEGDFKEWKQYGKVKASGVYDLVRENPVIRPVGTITSTKDKRCVKSIVEVLGENKKDGHPTQKPVELYKWLIERYSKEDDVVMDVCFGSGNSGRASATLKRAYVGIEKDAAFFAKYNDSLITK